MLAEETANQDQPKDPRSKANVFSRLFFFWLDALLFLGCSHDLKQSDLYAHPKETDSFALDKKFHLYWNQELQRKCKDKTPRLWMVFAKSFKWQFLLQFILSLLKVTIFSGLTVTLGNLMDYFTSVNTELITQCIISVESSDGIGSGYQTNVSASGMAPKLLQTTIPLSSSYAYLYAIGLFLLSAIVAILNAHETLIGNKLGMMSRIMSISAIYRKMMLLSQTTIIRITAGQVINIVSNDVQTLDSAFLYMPFLLIAPLHMAVFTYLSYQEVGWVTFLIIFIAILQIPVQFVLTKIFTKFRLKSAKVTDTRVRIMNEVITGIRVIKMYAWEYAFQKVVSALRKNEIHLIRIAGLMRILTISFNVGVSLTICVAITFVTFVKTGGTLTPRRVIVTLSLLNFLCKVCAKYLMHAIILLFEAKVALKRMQSILEEKEMEEEIDPDHKQPVQISSLPKGMELGDNILESSFHQSESSFLPRIWRKKMANMQKPIQLATITIFFNDSIDSSSVSLSGIDGGASAMANYSGIDGGASVMVHPSLQHGIIVRNLTATWKDEKDTKEVEKKETLKNISFEVSQDKPFLAVVGKVASGKSTLLQCLLKELQPLAGTVEVNGHLSYASQIPWIFHATLRDNILFGLPYNEERYQKVVDACALRSDFDHLTDGELTLVSEMGGTLSGGQKARVNLARAVYRVADIYLLDDPLSAVDASVGKHIYKRCIRGLLLHSQVILVTHQVQFAILADQLLILNEGEMLGYHSQAECQRLGLDHHELLKMMEFLGEEFECRNVENDEFEGEDLDLDDEDGEDSDNCFESPLISPSHVSAMERNYQCMLRLEDNPTANRKALVPISSFKHSISIRHQSISSKTREDNLPGNLMDPQGYVDNISILSSNSIDVDHNSGQHGMPEKNIYGTVSVKTYHKFFTAGVGYILLAIFMIIFVLGEFCVVLADTWLSKWSSCLPVSSAVTCNKSVGPICRLMDNERLGIYGAITVASIIINFIRITLFYLICINASRVLHNRMFGAIIRAPIRFFDSNSSGRILNRFSADIGFLDVLLPHTFLEYAFNVVKFLSILITASYSSPFILIPSSSVVVCFLAIRSYFLKSSRDIKRLESIARSPLYSHFSITLQGLPTIRTLCMQNQAHQILHRYQNEHTRGWFLYLATQQWFGMRIHLIVSLYLGIVALIFISLVQTLDAGVIGLALSYTISLTGVMQLSIRKSAEVENIMISTERILEYGKLVPEASLETKSKDKFPPHDWPKNGEISLNKVKFRYAANLPPAINNLKLHVWPSEKIGIVGRTGAGKSSLISILFRLGEPEGEIQIDNVDIKNIGLHDLRKKISIIPQDPVLFSGTMRYNLSPLDEYSDDQLWDALKQVQLKGVVEKMEGQLSGEVHEGGSNFSVGQRQLVCLARALLKNNRILILDEATANVDIGTDEIIQHAIRKNFQNCTVLTIAHRLKTIMDSTKIMVMNHGSVVEFDTPYELLRRRNGMLSRMVDKTGEEESAALRAMVNSPT